MNWQFINGRDFTDASPTDLNGLILNETAVKYTGLKNPVGQFITWNDKKYNVLGVTKDIVAESPYEPVKPTVFFINNDPGLLNIRINPKVSAGTALRNIEAVCRKFAPGDPFDYKFVDEEYAQKFSEEERIGKLSGFFAGLAIFISCLGLFGMASFMAGQRFKEIGVRKVLGASVFNLWQLLSKDFIVLVMISLFIAIPVSYYFMHKWLQGYQYRTNIAWWIFASVGIGTMMLTLFTVSYQSIKAALANPVKSLKSE